MKITVLDLSSKLRLLQNVDVEVNDKFSYAVKKLRTRYDAAFKPALDKFNEDSDELKITLALVDSDGGIITDKETGNYKFTPENLIKLKRQHRALEETLKNTELDFEPYFIDIASNEYKRVFDYLSDDDIISLHGILVDNTRPVVNKPKLSKV